MSFIDFNARYSRSYASREDHKDRFAIFRKNLRLIEEHNRKPASEFKLGINKFSDLNLDQFLDQFAAKPAGLAGTPRQISKKKDEQETKRTERYLDLGEEESWARKNMDLNNYAWLDE